MSTNAMRWFLVGNLMFTSALAAEPLGDLKARLAALHSDQPIKIQVEVELKHHGTAPLHLNDSRKRGAAIVKSGEQGVENIEQWWHGSSKRISVWKRGTVESEMPLIDETEASDYVDPSGTIGVLLDGATLLGDEAATWQGRPARLLTVRPGPLSSQGQDGQEARTSTEGGGKPLAMGLKIWLDEAGDPLALERTAELRLGGALSVTERQELTFQQVDGRLLVATARDSFSGTGLAVLHGRDDKKAKVSVLK